MTDTTRDHVIDRIESLASGAADEVEVPTFTVDRHRDVEPPRVPPHRWRLVAAAVAASIVVSGAAWAVFEDTGARSVRTAASDPTAEIDAMIPTRWPAGVDSEIVAHVHLADLRPFEMDDRVSAAVLELHGAAAATVIVLENSPQALSATPPGALTPDAATGTVDGHPALWWAQGDGTLIGYVEVAPNRTAVIASRTVDRGGLERLATEIARTGGEPFAATLPDGWTSSAPDSNLASLLMYGQPDNDWSTVSATSSDRRKYVSISTTPSVDADSELDRIRAFAGTTGQTVDVRVQGDGVLVPFSPKGSEGLHAVAWVPSPGLLSVAIGSGVQIAEIAETARSAERATRAGWDALLPDVDRTSTQSVEGFDIPATATAVASGESFGLRWMIIEDRPVIPEELEDDLAAVNLSVVIRDTSGRQGQLTWAIPTETSSVNGQIGRHFVIGALLPTGTTNVRIERNGERLAHERVASADGERDLYFTIVPAKDVDPDHHGTMTATLPDGRPYVAVR